MSSADAQANGAGQLAVESDLRPEAGGVDPIGPDRRWVLRLLRMGFAVAFTSNAFLIVANYLYLPPPLAQLTLPYSLLSVGAALIAGLWTLSRDFPGRWKTITFGFCVLMVAGWTGNAIVAGQQAGLFAAILVVLMATCCMTPWELSWQTSLTAWCVVCCAVDTLELGWRMPATAYLWLDLISAAILSLLGTRLLERRRAMLDQTNDQLRAEIDEHKATQKTLQQNGEMLRKALDANLDAVEIIRLSDDRYIYVNEAFLKRGHTREDVIGKSASEGNLRGNDGRPEEFLTTLRTQGFVRNMEVGIRMSDGSVAPHLVSSVVVDLAGEPCAISIARDVTELKRVQTNLMATVAELSATQQRLKAEIAERDRTMAERERAEARLRESETKLRKIFEACPDTICINRMSDGRYLECNKEFFSTGYSREEITANSSESLGLWVNGDEFRKLSEQLRDQGIARNLEADFQLKDGSVRSCLISGAVVELDGEPCAVTFTSDITRLKRTERELIAARETALGASRAKSEFLSSMSHEIRTPMNAILGMADLLAETALATDQQRYVNTMISNSNALLDLINGILDLAKVESGKLHLEESEFDLDDLIGRAMETLSVRAHEKRLELTTRLMPSVPPRLVGDALRLRQVLINLVGNAIKFTQHGEVALTIESVGNAGGQQLLRFSVRDTGIGIAPAKVDTIFQSFTQADSSVTRKYGGSGLGLAIARRLVELMGGTIWVESELGGGSTFHFTARLGICVEVDNMSKQLPDLSGMRVLIVDDNATNRLILNELLLSQGAETHETGGGSEAIAEFARAGDSGRPYGLVLLDCRMPEMDGFEVAERLRAHPADHRPIILMLTSDHLSPQRARLAECGIDSLVVKPVRRAELLQAISTAMAGQELAEEPVNAAENGASVAPERALNILFAEDSPDNRLLVQAYLQNLPYHLDVAENGQIALDKFTRGKYDVVLMDVQMPVMDGHTAVRKIRRWEKENRVTPTPIVALTASALSEDIRDSIDAGCTTHLSKPIKKARLLAAIHEFAGPETAAPDGNGYKIIVEVDPEISELIPDFLQHKRDDLSLLIGALERGDFDALRSIGHRMKGEGAGFGFQMMSEIGMALEEAGKNRNLKLAQDQVWALSRYLDHVEVTVPEQPAERE
jgi:PAS domain S-box-containing protein